MTQKIKDMSSFLIKKETDFYNRHYNKIYKGRIEKSTDKKYALQQYVKEFRFQTEFPLINEYFQQFISFFEEYERLGHSIDSALRLMEKQSRFQIERIEQDKNKREDALDEDAELKTEEENSSASGEGSAAPEEDFDSDKTVWNYHFSLRPHQELITQYAVWKANKRFLNLLQAELLPLQSQEEIAAEAALEQTSVNTVTDLVIEDTPEVKNKENTARRQTLAVYYLNEYFKINQSGKEIALTRFIHFLTDKNIDNIKAALRNPLKFSEKKRIKADEELLKDLEFIRIRFEDLKLADIIEQIDLDTQTVAKNIQLNKK